jgi:hypothetical protein
MPPTLAFAAYCSIPFGLRMRWPNSTEMESAESALTSP